MNVYIKIVSFLLVILLSVALLQVRADAKEDAITVSAKSACLIEAQSGRVLYSKNAEKQMPMASTTKIMTAIVALEYGPPLDTIVKTPPEAVGVEGSSIYLEEDEQITLGSLLYALMLSSANDAAIAIAHTVGGSCEKFVSLMNEKAVALGLSSTHFENPHGLDGKEHYTTAHDLACLLAYAIKNDTFLKISGTEKIVIPKKDNGTRVLINHNRLLKTCDGVISGKTGFTKKSGRCLASCAEREGLTLIAVTLDAPNDWDDHASLYDFGFENYQRVSLDAIKFSIPVISGQKSGITATSDGVSIFVHRSNGGITTKIEAPRFLFAPIKAGDEIGRVLYYCDGKLLATSPIYAAEDADAIRYKFNLFSWLIDFIKGLFD